MGSGESVECSKAKGACCCVHVKIDFPCHDEACTYADCTAPPSIAMQAAFTLLAAIILVQYLHWRTASESVSHACIAPATSANADSAGPKHPDRKVSFCLPKLINGTHSLQLACKLTDPARMGAGPRWAGGLQSWRVAAKGLSSAARLMSSPSAAYSWRWRCSAPLVLAKVCKESRSAQSWSWGRCTPTSAPCVITMGLHGAIWSAAVCTQTLLRG